MKFRKRSRCCAADDAYSQPLNGEGNKQPSRIFGYSKQDRAKGCNHETRYQNSLSTKAKGWY